MTLIEGQERSTVTVVRSTAPIPSAGPRRAGADSASTTRLVVLGVLVMALMATLLARLGDLQLRRGDDYAAAAATNRVREQMMVAPRGVIKDRTGAVLVGNRPAIDLALDPLEVARLKASDRGRMLADLAALTGVSANELELRAKPCGTRDAARPPRCWNGNPAEPAVVVRDIGAATAAAIMERRDSLPGTSTILRSARDYPSQANAAHVLGYLSSVTEAERAEGRLSEDLVGRGGLEQQYDADLRGVPGSEDVTVDRRGVVTSANIRQPAQPGRTLVTTIDAGLQAVVERELQKSLERARARVDRVTGRPYVADSGAAVVVDVTNGEVLAMASAPTFAPQIWVGGISSRNYKALTDPAAGTPLLSRATQGLFAPASTFKAFTTAAALESGYSSQQSYPCPARYRIGGTVFNNYESKGYGPISLRRSLEVSCDTVYYGLAHAMWKRDGGDSPVSKPADAITMTARGFGLGKKTGIDLPSEFAGRVGGRDFKQSQWEAKRDQWCRRAKDGYPEVSPPSRAEYLKALAQENCADGNRYRAGDAVNISIGQGDTAITPLQLAMAYAAIANGGTLWKPRLVSAITDAGGTVLKTLGPQRNGQVGLKPSTLSYLQDSLRSVTDNGTGGLAFGGFPLGRIPVASKTGTGEVEGKQTTSWFASYAPADKPKYAVVMMVSQGGSGARTAGPGVRAIYDAIFGVNGMSIDPSRSVLSGRPKP